MQLLDVKCGIIQLIKPFILLPTYYKGAHLIIITETDTNDRDLLSVELLTINRQSCTIITEKAPTRAFSWLKAPTSAFTFKTLLRHYAERALTPW